MFECDKLQKELAAQKELLLQTKSSTLPETDFRPKNISAMAAEGSSSFRPEKFLPELGYVASHINATLNTETQATPSAVLGHAASAPATCGLLDLDMATPPQSCKQTLAVDMPGVLPEQANSQSVTSKQVSPLAPKGVCSEVTDTQSLLYYSKTPPLRS